MSKRRLRTSGEEKEEASERRNLFLFHNFKSFQYFLSKGGSCRDKDNRCRAWASRGECRRNPAYMNVNCKQSCNKCSTTKEVTTKRCYTLPPPKTTTTDLIPPIPVTTNPIPPIPMTTDPLPTIPMTTDPIPPIPVVTTAVPPSVVTTEGVVIPPIPPTQEPTIKPQPPPTPDDCKMTEKYGKLFLSHTSWFKMLLMKMCVETVLD